MPFVPAVGRAVSKQEGAEMSNFDPSQSLGARSRRQIADYLMEIDDDDAARQFVEGNIAAQGLFGKKPWQHTGMVVGFIAENQLGRTAAVTGVSQVKGDSSLVNSRLKITLDKFYVHDYPGSGEHNILCEFTGKNQVQGEAEQLRYTLRFKARSGASPSLSGVPIFFGVNVGPDGIAFDGRAINVSSSHDETLLSIMESESFKSGLGLLTSAQPALKPFAALGGAVVSAVLGRSKNAQVHTFSLGLDFGNTSSAARLRLGTYVMVQCDDAASWDWSSYEWNRDSMALLDKQSQAQPNYNYMVYGVSRFSGPTTP